jgi:hypothetical protein
VGTCLIRVLYHFTSVRASAPDNIYSGKVEWRMGNQLLFCYSAKKTVSLRSLTLGLHGFIFSKNSLFNQIILFSHLS